MYICMYVQYLYVLHTIYIYMYYIQCVYIYTYIHTICIYIYIFIIYIYIFIIYIYNVDRVYSHRLKRVYNLYVDRC